MAPNHTATHVLNYALRAVLGDGVDQKGSLVDDEKLRFDFSHTKAMTVEQIKRVEAIVNDTVGKKLPVDAREVALADAQKISGLRAVFGEVYPDPVRVVSVGPAISDLLSDPSRSPDDCLPTVFQRNMGNDPKHITCLQGVGPVSASFLL